MPGKDVQFMTAERLRSEFGQALTELATAFVHDIDRMERAVGGKKMLRDYLEMNIKSAQLALRTLRVFHRREFHEKLEDALEGNYRWRVAERKIAKRRKSRRA
jgi:hypothetical protein